MPDVMADEEKKAEALAKLKRPKRKKKMPMDSEDMPMAENKEVSDDEPADHTKEYVPMSILSFDDWDAYEMAEDAAEVIQEETSVFMQLVYNNLYCGDIADKRKALVSLVNAYAQRLDPTAKKDNERELSKKPFMLIKEANGQYRWFAIYSNKFRDNDNPAEIISEKSHRTFTEMAMKGEVPMPELWQWHIPGSRWGVADSLYFGDDGFALATGLVDHGKEKVADAMMNTKETVLVSHGMPTKYLVRDGDDPTVINFHITKEISTLPGQRAANKLTGFSLLTKENDEMKLDQARTEWLKSMGYGEDEISRISENLSTKAADAATLESKEETKAEVEVVAAAVEVPVVEETKTEVVAEKSAEVASMNVKEVVEAVAEIIKPFAARLDRFDVALAALAQNQANQAGQMADKAATMIEETPALSLKELMSMAVFGQSAAVDGRSALAKDAPVEKEAKMPGEMITGISFLDQLIRNSQVKAQ